jgi:hypothetical protein
MGVAMMGVRILSKKSGRILTLAAGQSKVGDGRGWKPWYRFHCEDRLHWDGDNANSFKQYMNNSGNDRSSPVVGLRCIVDGEQVILKTFGRGASLLPLSVMSHSSWP